MGRTIPSLIKEGASVGETWIARGVVCFVMRSHGTRMQALPTASTASVMVFGGKEDRRGGRRPGLWGSGRKEFLLRINFRGDALLAGLRQMVIVCMGDSSLKHSLGAGGRGCAGADKGAVAEVGFLLWALVGAAAGVAGGLRLWS